MGFAWLFCVMWLLQGATVICSLMEKPSMSKFTIFISVEGLESFGADTPISLVAKERQIAFREVLDLRLKCILLVDDPATMAAVKMVLGKGHLERNEFSQDNTSISSWFLTVLLDIETLKAVALDLMVRLFQDDLLGGIETTLKVAFIGKGIPQPADFDSLWVSDEVVKVFPFLLDLKGPALSRHRMLAEVAVGFLKCKLKMEPGDGLACLEGFIQIAESNGFW